MNVTHLELTDSDKDISNLKERIIDLCKRRPSNLIDLSNSLGINMNHVIKCLSSLVKEEKIRFKIYNDSKYYYV